MIRTHLLQLARVSVVALSRVALTGLTVSLMLAAPATAQTAQTLELDRLKGITEVKILIEGLDADDTRCGISDGQLNAAATKALLDNGIRISVDSDPTLYIKTGTLYFDNTELCVTQFDIDLYEFLYATPSHSLKRVFGEFVLTEQSGLLSSNTSEHEQRIKDAVFEYVERIALAIRVANQ